MKRLLLICMMGVSLLSVKAQERGEAPLSHFQDLSEQFGRFYRDMPSMLSLWDRGMYSVLGIEGNFKSGDFVDFQQGHDGREMKVTTESMLQLSDWHFYGRFHYVNGKTFDVAENLQLHLPRNRNPFYFFLKQLGDWKYQQYSLEGAFSRSIVGDRLYVGMGVDYVGDLSFRYVDTRNEQYDFSIRLYPSLTWRVCEWLGMDLSYVFERQKSQPSVHNKYQHNGAGNDYTVYLNAGMGSYVTNVSSSNETVGYRHGGTLGVNLFWPVHRIDLKYGLTYGKSVLSSLYSSTDIVQEPRIGQFSDLEHRMAVNYHFSGNTLETDTYLDADVVRGRSALFSDKGERNENFVTNSSALNLGSILRIRRGPVSDCRMEIGFSNVHDTDLKYGQEITYGRLEPSGACNFDILLNRGRRHVLAGLDAGCGLTLWKSHELRSASENLYTIRIAQPSFAYHTTDCIHLGLQLGYAHGFGQGLVKYFIRASQARPFAVDEDLPGQYLSPKDYLTCVSFQLEYSF